MAQDILTLIEQDHDEVEALFGKLQNTPAEEREELFQQIVHELARHEAAEETIVHPRLRDDAPDGEELARSVLDEESEAESLMADMETMDPESDEFLTAFRRLRDDVLEHAEHEETEELPRLRKVLDEDERRAMGEKFQRVKDLGPTHPHPKTPQDPEVRKAAGPVAAAFDRARDAVSDLLS